MTEPFPGLFATPTGDAMRIHGAILIPTRICRADSLPAGGHSEDEIVTGLPAIGEDGADAPPGAPGGDGAEGQPGEIIWDGEKICFVQPDGSLVCTPPLVPQVSAPALSGINVFFDGGGAVLLNNTQIYQSVPFDADAQELKVFTDGTTGNVVVEVYRQPFGAWSPTLDTAERIASTVTSSITRTGTEPGTVGVGSVDGVVALNAGDTLIFNTPLGSLSDVTKVHASLVVARR